jgi:molybdopterin molybdotransferase
LLGIGRDRPEDLRRQIEGGRGHDVLLISGGVSAGKLDLVPSVLRQLGVRQVFHKVCLKPGKPLWFGVLQRNGPSTLVFGLPGNPVSSLVCFQLFVRPALKRMMGLPDTGLPARKARLVDEYQHVGDRPVYHPSVVFDQGDGLRVRTLRWEGSADLRTLTEANCLALFPRKDHLYRPGDWIETHDL